MEEKKSKTGLAVCITIVICLIVMAVVGYGCYMLGRTKSFIKSSTDVATNIINSAKDGINKAIENQDAIRDKIKEEAGKIEEEWNNGFYSEVVSKTTNEPVIVYYKTDSDNKTTRYIITNKEAVNKVNDLLKNKTKTACKNPDDCSGVGIGSEVYIITDGSVAETIYNADGLTIVYNDVFYDLKGNKTIVDILNEYIK